eukprot:1136301-Pelagomonas_calceolata.AAC.1
MAESLMVLLVHAVLLYRDAQMGGLYTGIRPVHIYPTSRLVSDCSGMMVQPHKAIVGANAFSHESGIHQVSCCVSRKFPDTVVWSESHTPWNEHFTRPITGEKDAFNQEPDCKASMCDFVLEKPVWSLLVHLRGANAAALVHPGVAFRVTMGAWSLKAKLQSRA